MFKPRHLRFACILPIALSLCGCTSLPEYVRNGFKVGPNYAKPPAPVAKDWIDAADKRVRQDSDDLSQWWKVFNDPVLDALICDAYKQNLTLRQAGFRILEARAQLGIARGEFFPQTQDVNGSYSINKQSQRVANAQYIPQATAGKWNFGFGLAWEVDFWGRFRRAIESAEKTLDASVENYDDVLVTLLSDVATYYVNMRVFEERIRYARENVKLQKQAVDRIELLKKAGTARQLDVDQAKTILYQTDATIPELEIGLQQARNQLCILMGIPPEDLRERLGNAPTPVAPTEVTVGIPADLLRRRPDVRRAERQAAAQSAQIGIAESDFYPQISIVGNVGITSEQFKPLFTPAAVNGAFGPSFQWNILLYGRIINNVRLQDATFKELVVAYQNTVLNAGVETENGLVTFLKAQERTRKQADSVKYAESAAKALLDQYEAGLVNIAQVILVLQTLVQEQDLLAQAKGEIPTGLIQVYKALGGGWQIRLNGCDPANAPTIAAPPANADQAPPQRAAQFLTPQ